MSVSMLAGPERPKAALRVIEPAEAVASLSTKTRGAATDFTIEGPETHGLPGLLNLYGIESPGLTSSLAIAEAGLRLLEG